MATKSSDTHTDATAAAKPTSDSDTAKRAARRGTVQDGDIQFFDGTIVKINRDGDEVMSDHLEPGEVLRRDTTDRYTAVKGAHDDQADTKADAKDTTKAADKATVKATDKATEKTDTK